MTAAAADRLAPQLHDEFHATMQRVPLAASTKIYAGTLVAINISGYAVPASADGALRVIGVADKQADNSSGSAGDVSVNINRGTYGFINGSTTDALSTADIGQFCYALDDQTVTRTPARGARPLVGRVILIENSKVYCEVGHSKGRDGDVDITVIAGADLSSKQYLCMTLASDGTVNTTGTAGGDVMGVLQNTPASGAVAVVRTRGITKVIASGTIASGLRVASTSAGKTKQAVAGKTDTSDAGAAADPLIGSYAIGQAITDGATDTAHYVDLHQMGAIPSTPA